jgi:hypothetical protein
MDEIRAMAADLERFVDAKPGTVKSETIADRIQQYKDVKNKVSMYATLLSMHQTDIIKELDGLTEKAKAIVLGGKGSSSPTGTTKSTEPAQPVIPAPVVERERPADPEDQPPIVKTVPPVTALPLAASASGSHMSQTIQTSASMMNHETPRLFI